MALVAYGNQSSNTAYNKRLQNDRTSAMHLCSLPSVGGV